ncbi:MAG: hypothetical protein KC434_13080 [Anaerolineales bacterium]|nr:hypothetical protein [Anaerolineales bacterium]
MRRFLCLLPLWLLLSACTPSAETAVSPSPSPETAVLPTATFPPPIITNTDTPGATATAVPDPTATTLATVEPTAVATVTETGGISGRTADGAFFLGAPNAPITHIDYSDFL